ncbi:hypothetical protein, partial [Pseudomonas guariconensis]|uniref:hypothetical protein n=1 Tax=Pseudomonas guariconensis TaxID=1288410 RepID=UPI00209A9747
GITSLTMKDGYRDKTHGRLSISDSNERPLSEESPEVKSRIMVLEPPPYLAISLEVLGPEAVKEIKTHSNQSATARII